MIAILKNDWRRFKANKGKLILVILLTFILVPAIFWFNFHLSSTINIQVNKSIEMPTTVLENIKIEKVTKAPKKSKLISGEVDAYIEKQNGEFKIMTAKNQEFKDKLLSALLDTRTIEKNDETNQTYEIKSFQLVLFLALFIGMVFSFIISEDKEKRIISRLFTTKINLINYLLGHVLFIFISVFSLISLGFLEVYLMMPGKITLNFFELLILIFTTSILAVVLSVFFSSWFETNDTAMMFGQFGIILLSLLSGSFYTFDTDSKLINQLITILPIKQLNTLVDNLFVLEKFSWQPVFLVISIAILLLITTVKPLKKYGGIIR